MKIGGVDPSTLSNIEILVLPRGNQQIVFKATGLANYDQFDKLCPEPKPPGVLKPNEGWVPNVKDKSYIEMMANWGKKRFAYMAIKSLEPSEIEWDTVSLDNPSTWLKWQDELKANGFTQVEVNRIAGLVLDANCLNEERLEKARALFQLGQAPMPGESCGLTTEPSCSPSGEPVKG